MVTAKTPDYDAFTPSRNNGSINRREWTTPMGAAEAAEGDSGGGSFT